MIKLNQHSAISGRFQIEKHTVDGSGAEVPGSRHVAAPWTDNLITDSGLDNMAAQYFMEDCSIGAGNAAPAPSDTELGAPLAQVRGAVDEGPSDPDEGYNSVVGTYVFGQGEGEGIISELGVRSRTGPITTRALIRDQDGNPTTIVKGPMDVLTVTYQLREYPDQSDAVNPVVNPHTSVEYTVTSRSVSGAFSGRLARWHQSGAINNANSVANRARLFSGGLTDWDAPVTVSAGTAAGSVSYPSYGVGNYYRDVVYTWNEGDGNVPGGVNSLSQGNESGNGSSMQPFFMQAAFSPAIDKDNTKTLIITLRKSWGRYEP